MGIKGIHMCGVLSAIVNIRCGITDRLLVPLIAESRM